MNHLFKCFKKIVLGAAFVTWTPLLAEECNETTMDAFAYEDCIAAISGGNGESFGNTEPTGNTVPETSKYAPFGKDAYLTSSFGENRGTRYHLGIDYSTDMQEGWPVYAPEDGMVKEIKTSPYGYGKVMFFKGVSGNTWVFAHQSSFGARLDSMVLKKMLSSKKNDVSVTPNVTYRKGDTLTFAGSTGIGNPHLHLEIRTGNNKALSPCGHGVQCADTIAPQIFAAAAIHKNDVAFTSQGALDAGCVETPIQNTYEDESPVRVAFKIADYSRLPKENPMSVRRVELFRYDEKIFSKIHDTLSMANPTRIRDELLWAEEADTAGDWHFLNALLPPQSTYRIEVEDYKGNVTMKKFNLRSHCKNNEPFAMTRFQESPLFTYLSKPMISFAKCDESYSFEVYDGSGNILGNLCNTFPKKYATVAKIAEVFPTISYIKYSNSQESNNIYVYVSENRGSNLNWKANVDGMEISQKISGLTHRTNNGSVALAFVKNHTDSLDFFEFHPKGLQFTGKWDVCLDRKTTPNPLYWLGETKRGWNIFSKQTKGKTRCASTNELRDIASIDNPNAPALGFAYWANTIVGGVHIPSLRIPLIYRYSGLEDGNAVTVTYKNRWIPAEFDSEPRELVIIGELLPEDNETIKIQIKDEAGNKVTHEVTIPEL